MKNKLFKIIAGFLFGLMIFSLSGCKVGEEDEADSTSKTSESSSGSSSGSGSGGSGDSDSSGSSALIPSSVKSNPTPYGKRTQNLDFIFNPDVLGTTTVTITRSSWNSLCKNYENDTYSKASYKFEKKDGDTSYLWQFDEVGIRVRGNTSRVSPQTSDGKYIQSHFKIDFEEFISDPYEIKMAGCMKGVNLKRFKNDPTYAREVFAYNFFRNNGIWMAPRASYTRLILNIVDGNSTETIDYGIYAMIEDATKQFIKERATKKGGKLLSDDGNLWKCGYGASLKYGEGNFGVSSHDGNCVYDLKTNKENINAAEKDFTSWLKELSELSDGSAECKTWLENHLDVNFFLKTYAVNVVLGMWDDYWTNKNNYYFYFDTDKAYFIPYDYDNILGFKGCNNNNPAEYDPFNWGYANCSKGDRPLMDKILSVPEFKVIYADYLVEVTKNEYYSNAVTQMTAWQNMVKSYVSGADVSYGNGSGTEGSVENASDLQNFFDKKASSISRYCGSKITVTVKAALENDGSYFVYKNSESEKASEVQVTAFDGSLLSEVVSGLIFISSSNSYISGWKDGNGNSLSSSSRISGDTTLFPVWAEKIAVTVKASSEDSDEFKVNKSSSADKASQITVYVEEGVKVSDVVSSVQFTNPSNYYISGWKDGDGNSLETSSVINGAVTLIPVWIYDENVYLPCSYDSENQRWVFVFRPLDYEKASGITSESVMYVRGEMNSWSQNDDYIMTYDSEKNIFVYYLSDASGNYSGKKFKFFGENNWFGGGDISASRQSIASFEDSGNKNFIMTK